MQRPRYVASFATWHGLVRIPFIANNNCHLLADCSARRQRLDARNRTIGRTQARVEHVFARLEQLGGKAMRAMNLARDELAITLKCVACNVKRLVWLAGNDTAGAR